jgi:hypothetical protein
MGYSELDWIANFGGKNSATNYYFFAKDDI